MAPTDWRRPESYDYLGDLDSTGLAWEFLRRNPDYQRAYRACSAAKPPIRDDLTAPIRPWGLTFSRRSRAFDPRPSRILVAIHCAKCRQACSSSA
jgi:hypothetical protein